MKTAELRSLKPQHCGALFLSSWRKTILCSVSLLLFALVENCVARPAPRQPSANLTDSESSHPDDSFADRRKLSDAQFKQLSRMAFKSLVGKDFRGSVLPDAQNGDRTKSRRRKNRRRNRRRRLGGKKSSDRRRLPNRPQALALTKVMLADKATCSTALMKQKVRMDRCLPKMVVNRFCYGQCNSFFIPKIRVNRLKPAFQSCSVCAPIDYAPVEVTFQCPQRHTPLIRRTVIKVKRCECKAIELSTNQLF